MPLRNELASPAMRAAWQMPPAERQPEIFEILRSPDLAVVVVLLLAGLVAAIGLTVLFPFSDDIAAFLAQVS
jgi:hypothetical protein